MTELSQTRSNIHVEETQFIYGLSEALFQKVGKSINFINEKQYAEKQWFVNGDYSGLVLPYLAIDGLAPVKYDMTIIDAFMFASEVGGAGTTELDIKVATASGGAFATIFSTTPKIAVAAGDYSFVFVGGSGAGLTAPVIGTADIDAGSALRMDVIQSMTGSPRGAGIVLMYRPR